MVFILLGDGFEEIEALAPLDLLRRADIEVATVSLMGDLIVRGGHNLTVKADITLEQVDIEALEMLVLPGGGEGVASIADSKVAMRLIKRIWEEGKLIGAICAAPSLLAVLNIINGMNVACHPTVAGRIIAVGGKIQPEFAVNRDRNLITGKAVGASMEFGLELVAALRGHEESDNLRRAIYYGG